MSCQKYRGEEKKGMWFAEARGKKKKKNYNNWVAENVREEKKKRKEKELWLAKAGEKKGTDQWSGRNCGLP